MFYKGGNFKRFTAGSFATMVLISCCWCHSLGAFRTIGAMTMGVFTHSAGSTMLERSGVRGQAILHPLVLRVGGWA